MRVGLIQPSSPFLIDQAVHGPLGLWYLGAALKRAGHEVVYCDRGLGDELPDADVWALTGTTPQRNEMGQIMHIRSVPIIIGGPHATVAANDVREVTHCLVVQGEGEIILPKIIANDDWWKCGIVRSERIKNLDALPFPDRSQSRRYHYTLRDRNGKEHKAATAITSRGCPHRCAFCSKGVWNGRYTARSVCNVLAEMRELKVLGYDAVHFYDDSLAISRTRLRNICYGLFVMGIVWRCFVRADQMDEEILGIMAADGCIEIGLGVESGSQKILDAIHKGETVKQQERAIEWAHKLGIRVKAFLIVGLPKETPETITETADFLERTRPDDIDVTIFQAYPGSAIYEDPAKYGITLDGSGWYKGRPGEYWAHHRTEAMTAEELVEARDHLELLYKAVKV